MQKMQINPNNSKEMISFLESLDTQEKLLENSLTIYGSPLEVKKAEIANVVRYGDLTIEQLSSENNKITNLMNIAIENNIPMSEKQQEYLVEMSNLVRTRIMQSDMTSVDTKLTMLGLLEDSLAFPEDLTFVSESVNPYASLVENLETISNCHTITARGLFESCDAICSPFSSLSDAMRGNLKCGLIDKLQNTMKIECKDVINNPYGDMPLLQAMSMTRDILKQRYADKFIDDEIDELMDELDDSVEDIFNDYVYRFSMENGFNPNPFSVYSLTPFDVGSRTITRTLNDFINAEDDNAAMEALSNLTKIYYACESTFPSEDIEIVTEKVKRPGFIERTANKVSKIPQKARNVGKKIKDIPGNVADGAKDLVSPGGARRATRKIATKSERAANKVSGVGKNTKEVGDNLGKAAAPWAKFVQDAYDKYKKADKEERRNVVLKGGLVNKLIHYLKRGCTAYIAGGAVGLVAGGPLGAIIGMIIGFLGSIAVDRELDNKERAKILKELEDELEIVKEKIEDSKYNDDKSKKYELMRIRANLEKEIDRITLGVGQNKLAARDDDDTVAVSSK